MWSWFRKEIGRLVLVYPTLYDRVQIFFGLGELQMRLRPHLAGLSGKRVLDVGAGTGLHRRILPASALYCWLDLDIAKFARYRERGGARWAVLGDAAHLCFRNRTMDAVLCVCTAHHLSEGQLEAMLAGVARVVQDRLIFVDAVNEPRSLASRLLWRWDNGRFPRSADALRAAIARHFDIDASETFHVYHHYLLCVARPRREAAPPCP